MILRAPNPWLVRKVTSLIEDAERWRSRALRAAARARLGTLVVPSPAVADELVRASSARLSGQWAIEAMVAANLSHHGLAAVEAGARAALDRLPARAATRLYQAALRALAAESPASAIAFGERNLAAVGADPEAVRALAACHERGGAIARPLELLSALADPPGATCDRLATHAAILARGVAFGAHRTGTPPRTWTPAPGRVLYYVNQCLPHHSSGYAIRTHWLARTLARAGWDMRVQARYGYPNDRYDFLGVRKVPDAAEIDGLRYAFTPRRRGFGHLGIEGYHRVATAALLDRVARARPEVIHAASNYMTGLAAADVAARVGIPCIYEVRGLWHMTRAATRPEYADSDHYRMIERLEAQAAHGADHVFVITEAVGQVLAAHGVPADKISVLPNAVDTEFFAPAERDRELARAWGIGDEVVIGYIGSFKHYEGLEYLVEAAARLRAHLGDGFRVVLVGDGEAEDSLRSLARRLGVGDLIAFTGRQPHARIRAFYSLMDVMVFPRKGARVCEVVSPLKPLEAMATGKAVVASSVQALAEIVAHERTGLLHRTDDPGSLHEQLARCLTQPALRRELAARGRAWVCEQRSWSRIAEIAGAVYQDLGATRGGAGRSGLTSGAGAR